MTQHTLLAQYYTLLHNFCSEESFPEPPQSAVEIIQTWDDAFRPVKHDVEAGLSCIAKGKAAQTSMRIEEKTYGSVTGLNLRNGVSSQVHRQPSGQPAIEDKPYGSANIRNGVSQRLPSNPSNTLKPHPSPTISAYSEPPSPDYRESRPKISSVPSQTSLGLATPNYSASAITSPSQGDQTVHAPAGPRSDYFTRDRLPSNSSLASVAAGKKKPPPPPPPKKKPSTQGFWVTALYDFAGQGHGDLAFRERDRIKVVKKTDSTDDWWEGELNGVQGSFPANYCQPT